MCLKFQIDVASNRFAIICGKSVSMEWHVIDVAMDSSVFNQKIGEWKGRFNEMQQQKYSHIRMVCVVVKSIY